MKEFLILFHRAQARKPAQLAPADWETFLGLLRAGDHLRGGSELAAPNALKHGLPVAAKTKHVAGFMIIRAKSLTAARALLRKSPPAQNGSLVEIFPLVAKPTAVKPTMAKLSNAKLKTVKPRIANPSVVSGR